MTIDLTEWYRLCAMDPGAVWERNVGEQNPAEFMERHETDDPRLAIEAYVTAMPEFFGTHTAEELDTIKTKLVAHIEQSERVTS